MLNAITWRRVIADEAHQIQASRGVPIPEVQEAGVTKKNMKEMAFMGMMASIPAAVGHWCASAAAHGDAATCAWLCCCAPHGHALCCPAGSKVARFNSQVAMETYQGFPDYLHFRLYQRAKANRVKYLSAGTGRYAVAVQVPHRNAHQGLPQRAEHGPYLPVPVDWYVPIIYLLLIAHV